MSANGHGLSGGRLLGAPQQVAITEMQVVPLLYIEVVDNIGGVAAAEPVLRIVNPLSGLAVFLPISPQGARNLIQKLQAVAGGDQDLGGADGNAAVHE